MSKLPNVKNSLHVGYGILEAEVLPKLKNFQEDITKHDKAALSNYQGDFVSLYRETGTHLFKYESVGSAAKWTYKNPEESIRLTHEGCMAMVEANQSYLYVSKNGEFRHIEKSEVVKLMEERHERAIQFYKRVFLKMNFDGMANIIEFCMNQYGRTWKSKLIANWDNDYCSPEERRLRNQFGREFLQTIKFGTAKEDIRKSLIDKYMKDK